MTSTLLRITFCIKKANTGSFSGQADSYRRLPQTCLMAVASSHPKDILAVLTNNFTLGSGETFDVLETESVHVGSSGANVLS